MTTTYILAGWLIDSSGEPVREKILLTIENGTFAAIEKYIPDQGIDSSQVIYLSHCTLLPPLVDNHAHLFMSGATVKRIRESQLTAGYEELRPESPAISTISSAMECWRCATAATRAALPSVKI